MAADPAKPHADLDPPLFDEEGQPISVGFANEADYEAWLMRHPEQRVFQRGDPHAESRRRWAAWRAAGHDGPPPGYVRRTDYERQRDS
jgi:hypothetical protein